MKATMLFIVGVVISVAFVLGEFRLSKSQIDILQRLHLIKKSPLNNDLKKAITAGDAVKVQKLISEGASLKADEKSNDMSPLLLALSKKESRVAEVLIRSGAHVGETELKYAIINVDAEAIKVALSKNKIIPTRCKDCVQAAARLGEMPLTAYLLSQLAKSDELKSGVYQKAMAVLLTMPHWSPEKRAEYEKTYDYLASKGANANTLIDGYLPLMSFATRTHLYSDRFAFLKSKGVGLNTQDKDGNTYLHFAARGRKSDYDKFLELGLDSSIKNNAGETASDILAKTSTEN